MKRHLRYNLFVFAGVLAFTLSGRSASAQNLTWSGTANGDWSTFSNWTTSGIPGTEIPSTVNAVVLGVGGFSGATAGIREVTLSGTQTLSSLTISGGSTNAQNYLLTGPGQLLFSGSSTPASLTLSGPGNTSGAVGPTIATNIAISGTLNASVAATGLRQATISGNITSASGAAVLDFNGTGNNNSKIILTGSNDFGGGEVRLSSRNSLQLSSSAALKGATLVVSGTDAGVGIKQLFLRNYDYDFNGMRVETNAEVDLSTTGAPTNTNVGWQSTWISDGKILKLNRGNNNTLLISGTGKVLSIGNEAEARLDQGQANRFLRLEVGDGALLEGNGKLTSRNTASGSSTAFRVNSGGIIDPGIGLGNTGILRVGTADEALDANTSVQFLAGSTVRLQLNGLVAGSGHDQISVDSGTLSLETTGDGVTLSLSVGYAYKATDVVTLIKVGDDATLTGSLFGLAEGATVNLGMFSGSEAYATISYTGGSGHDVILQNFVVVPEPNALALIGLAAGGLLFVRRYRSVKCF